MLHIRLVVSRAARRESGPDVNRMLNRQMHESGFVQDIHDAFIIE